METYYLVSVDPVLSRELQEIAFRHNWVWAGTPDKKPQHLDIPYLCIIENDRGKLYFTEYAPSNSIYETQGVKVVLLSKTEWLSLITGDCICDSLRLLFFGHEPACKYYQIHEKNHTLY